jgi:hypothetical protein
MKFYCAACLEEMGNCHPWCPELNAERSPEDADNDPYQMLNDGEAEA